MEFATHWDAVFNPQKGHEYFDRADQIPFRSDSAEFSAASAWWLAELSRWIYNVDGMASKGRALPRQHLARSGLKETGFFSHNGTHAALVEAIAPPHLERFAILVFRGSSEPRNWLTNARAITSRTHLGYERSLDQVWKEVDQVLAQHPGPLFYTGHSMGGALAILAARRRQPRAVYAIGSPPVTHRNLTGVRPDLPVFQIINYRDLVSRRPIASHHPHIGLPIYISHTGDLWLDPDPESVTIDRRRGIRNRTRRLNRSKFFRIPEAVSDHAPVNYVAHLERLALTP